MGKKNKIKKSATDSNPFSDFQKIDMRGDIFKQMFKYSVIPTIIHDLDMNILNVNDSAELLFGYSHEEFLKLNIFHLHTDNELEHSEEVLNEMKQKEKMSVETSFKRKDGTVFYAEATPCKFLLKDKPVIHVYIQDITERKKAEKALKESTKNEKELADIVRKSPLAIAYGFPDGRLDKCNQAFSELTGYTLEELKSIDWNKVLTPKKWEHSEKDKLATLSTTNNAVSYEKEYIRKDGKVIPIELVVTANFDDNEQLINFVGFVRDITERKQAEQDLKESQERYYAIFNSAQIPIVITNREGYVVQFNKAAHEQTGYSAEEYAKINMSQIDVTRNNPEEIDKIVSEIRKKGFVIFEAQHRNKKGDILDIIVYASNVQIKGENFNLAVFNDVTSLKRIENELIRKNKDLEQFNYIASHDLQEPLNSIIAFTNLLEDNKENLDDLGKQSIDVIVRSAYRMKDFITSLLEYSRIGRDKKRTEVDIIQLFENLKTDLLDLAERKGAEIIYSGKPMKIRAFEQDLTMLFQNIVVNGIKYSREGIPPVIEINSEEQANKYLFSISDNGIGIPEDQYDKIFEVFQRLHSRGEYSGTGIGLSHCKKVVELHKGNIWLKSKLGVGTTFYFTISKR